jgi:hypothetical protein
MFAAYTVWKNTPQEVAISKFFLINRPEKQFYSALSASNCVLLNTRIFNLKADQKISIWLKNGLFSLF